jgi:hypothetical protein
MAAQFADVRLPEKDQQDQLVNLADGGVIYGLSVSEYNASMNVTTTLDRLLEPVGKCLSRKAAQALANLRADAEAQARIEELAEKCTEGKLTRHERAEYEAYVSANNLIAILQAKARAVLARHGQKK